MEGDRSSSRDAGRRQRIDEQQEQLESLGKRISDLDGANEAETRRARDAGADEPDAGAGEPEREDDAGRAGE